MMDRRRFLLTGLASALAVPRAEAQQARKVWRIGLLDPVGDLNAKWLFEVFFRQEMTKFGYIEGKNVLFEYRTSRGHDDLLPGLARELVNLNPDVLVTSAGATRAAKEATATIPIVMATNLNPVASGYVASLARPGGNITGSTEQTDELSAKRVDLIRQAIPNNASRIAVLIGPTNVPSSLEADVRRTTLAAKALSLTVVLFEVRGHDDLPPAFITMRNNQSDGLIVLSGRLTYQDRARIAELALRHRLPCIYAWREGAEAGALMSYGIRYVDQFRRAAIYTDKILRGARPADLPVQQPTTFELVINLKTAKALGLTIPPALLAQADHVIE
jgi:putative ABC transport system substrate-binding protein